MSDVFSDFKCCLTIPSKPSVIRVRNHNTDHIGPPGIRATASG